MGWYVTCDVCGAEGKYGPVCGCSREEDERCLESVKGGVIKEIVMDEEAIYQKILAPDGKTICISISLAAYTERCSPRRVREVPPEEFPSPGM